MELPEINRSRCQHKHKGVLRSSGGRYPAFAVQCATPAAQMLACWFGPECETRAGAINAWNRVMPAAKEGDD